MTADLVPFAYEGAELRSVLVDGEPWFITADALALLDLGRSSTTALDDDEKGVHSMDTLGGKQSAAVISESGLYSLILRSRKDEAKAIKRWITREVLPAIRKTGTYTVALPETREELLARAVLEATSALAEKDAHIAELEPKAKTFDVFLSTVGDYSVNEAAKVLSRDHGILTGQQRLFTFMEKLCWIYRDGKGKPVPYQTQVENGRLVAKPQFHYHPETGEVVADPPQIRVTAKGLEALHQKYLAAAS